MHRDRQPSANNLVTPIVSCGGGGGKQSRSSTGGGSDEVLETARKVGFPGAFAGLTCRDIERLIRNGLLWES